jgi:hypothetical protein
MCISFRNIFPISLPKGIVVLFAPFESGTEGGYYECTLDELKSRYLAHVVLYSSIFNGEEDI